MADPSALDVEFLEIGIEAAQLPGAAVGARTMLRSISTLRGFRPEMMLRDAMEALTVPTTFAWGERDAFAPPSSGHELAARMPDATVVDLPGLGHMPQVEDPTLVANVITRATDGSRLRR